MAANSKIARAPLGGWHAESLRLTAFPSTSDSISTDGWWMTLLDEEPETRINRPKIMERVEEGTFHGANLTLRIRPFRIDWILKANLSDTEVPLGFLTIGEFEEACTKFCQIMKHWFPLSPNLDRLAFGITVLLPVANRNAGYNQLGAYLRGVQLDPEGMSDFMYRVNRRRKSELGIKGLEINRLSTWAVARSEFHALTIGPERTFNVPQGEPTFACRILLDINSVSEFKGNWNSEQSEKIFGELVELGLEIIRDGDCP